MAQMASYTPDPKAMEMINRLPVEAVRKLTAYVAVRARANAPKGNPEDHPEREGQSVLKRSIRTSTKMRKGSKALGGVYYGKVFTVDHKGGLIEKGTGLYGSHNHMIVPKNRPFMSFRVGGKWTIAHAVSGRKGTPYLGPALKDMIENLKSILGQMV